MKDIIIDKKIRSLLLDYGFKQSTISGWKNNGMPRPTQVMLARIMLLNIEVHRLQKDNDDLRTTIRIITNQ